MPSASFVDFAELKSRLPIERVCRELLGVEDFSSSGAKQLIGSCPACHVRAFKITPAINLANCFRAGCSAHGDIIKLVARVRGYEGESAYPKAAQEIHDHFFGTSAAASPEHAAPTGSSNAGLATVHATLKPEHELVQALGISKETCEHFGAGYKPSGLLAGRLAIPIHDLEGTLVAYCGYALKGEEDALAFPKDFPKERYILNAHRIESGVVTVTRDPLKVLTAFEAGDENVVAIFGDYRLDTMQQLVAFMVESGVEAIEPF